MDRRCPNCRASLDADLADRTGRAVCPFCGEDVSDLDIAAADERGDASERFGTSGGGSRVGDVPHDDDRLPPGGLLTLVEASDDRLVIAIPPGGRGMGGLGCFAVIWTAVSIAIGSGFAFEAVRNPDWELLPPLLMIGLFVAIGLGLGYVWIRSRYLSTYILLEPERLAIQRVLFGRKSTKVTTLDGESRATLESSYSENDEPIYHVEVRGVDRRERFGLRLGDEEKAWLVGAFNRFLHPNEATSSAGTGDDDAPLRSRLKDEVPTTAVEPLQPHEIPPDSPVRVEGSSYDELRFSLPVITGKLAAGCGYGCGCLGAIWVAVPMTTAVIAIGAGGPWLAIAFPILVSLPGLASIVIGGLVRFSRLVVRIDADRLRLRWGLGPFGYNHAIPLPTITQVGLGTTFETSSNGKSTHRGQGCLVRAGEQSYPLTTNHGEEVGRQVAGLVRAALEDRGVRLQEL